MRYRPLGESGIEASVVGFGAWAVGGWMWGGTDEAESIKAIQSAIDAGITLVDTAPVYGFGVSEEIVGKAIAGRRDSVVLATKCGLVWDREKGNEFFRSDRVTIRLDATEIEVHRYLGPESIRNEIEESLKRLRVDTIDLYQTHWQDATTPIADTMAELLKLRDEGKIRAIGVSNVTTEHLEEYRQAGAIASAQERYSMLDRGKEADVLPYCADTGLAFLAYSPLASGLLTGKIAADRVFGEGDQRDGKPRFAPENLAKVSAMLEAMRPVLDKHGASCAQLAVAWALHQRGCTHALVGARNPAQARENAAAGDLMLDPEDLSVIAGVLAERGGGIR